MGENEQELPVADQFGAFISGFVNDRIAGPESPDDSDLWTEGVCAALFFAAFRLVFYIPEEQVSPRALQRETEALIHSIERNATPWVEAHLEELARRDIGTPVEWNLRNFISTRLRKYFNSANSAIAKKDYSLEDASSHAVRSVLTLAIVEMSLPGKALPSQRVRDDVEMVLTRCKELDEEIYLNLQHMRRK